MIFSFITTLLSTTDCCVASIWNAAEATTKYDNPRPLFRSPFVIMKDKITEPEVQNLSGAIIAIGPKSDDGEYPHTLRLETGSYEKVWQDNKLQRGQEVQLDLVRWPNGWVDKYIV